MERREVIEHDVGFVSSAGVHQEATGTGCTAGTKPASLPGST